MANIHSPASAYPADKNKSALTTTSLLICEALLVIAWSSGFVGMRFSIAYTSVFLVVFWRCIIIMLILFPFVMKELRNMSPAIGFLNAGIGLLAMAGYLAGVGRGIELGVPAGIAALMADLLPIGTTLLSMIFLRERPKKGVWLGLLLGLSGVLMVTWGALSWRDIPLWAYGFPLLGMLSLAAATLLQKKMHKASPVSLTATLWVQCAISALAFAGLAGAEGSLLPHLSTGFVLSVGWTALFSTLGGYGLYWLCLQRTSSVRVTSILFLSPPVTLLWAWAMFGEPLSWQMLVGMLISLSGIGWVVKSE